MRRSAKARAKKRNQLRRAVIMNDKGHPLSTAGRAEKLRTRQ